MRRRGSGGILVIGFAIVVVIFLLIGYMTRLNVSEEGTHNEFVDTVNYIGSVVSVASRMPVTADEKLEYVDDTMESLKERLEQRGIFLDYNPMVSTEIDPVTGDPIDSMTVYYIMSKGETHFTGSPSDILNLGAGIGSGGYTPPEVVGPDSVYMNLHEDGKGNFDITGKLSFEASEDFVMEYYYTEPDDPPKGLDRHGYVNVEAGDTVEIEFDLVSGYFYLLVEKSSGHVNLYTCFNVGNKLFKKIWVDGKKVLKPPPGGLRFETSGKMGTVELDADAHLVLNWGNAEVHLPDFSRHYYWSGSGGEEALVVHVEEFQEGLIGVVIGQDKAVVTPLDMEGVASSVEVSDEEFP